jgi:8-oxo-dGTP pyrophosphatase MutT (NUDIX family)
VQALVRPDLVVVRAAVERGGRLLLVRRAAWDTLPGAWELPGGKLDAGERPQIGLARELAEETGLVADGPALPWFELPVVSPSGRRVAERIYRVGAVGTPALSDEHDDLLWHDPRQPFPAPLTESASAALAYRVAVTLLSPRGASGSSPRRSASSSASC